MNEDNKIKNAFHILVFACCGFYSGLAFNFLLKQNSDLELRLKGGIFQFVAMCCSQMYAFSSLGKGPLKLMHIGSSKHSADFPCYCRLCEHQQLQLQLQLLRPAGARFACSLKRLRSSAAAPADPRPGSAHSSSLPAAAWLFVPRQPRCLAPFFHQPQPPDFDHRPYHFPSV